MEDKRTVTSREEAVISAWQEQVAQIARSPRLQNQVAERGNNLFPRFAENYKKLKALPRRIRRATQKKWKNTLAGVALMLALSGAPAMAAIFNIPCPGGIGDNAQLIGAIDTANSTAAADTIILGDNCIHTLTAPALGADFFGPNGLPVITTPITIEGNGSTIQRSSAAETPDFRILAVNGQLELTGDLILMETTISGGETSNSVEPGAGVFVYRGSFSITDSTISNNSTSGIQSLGGGVFTFGSFLTITDSIISGNSTSGSDAGGGGVFAYSNYSSTITNSTISGNSTSGDLSDAGGVFNDGVMTITESVISNNWTLGEQSDGAGVFNGLVGTIEITDSTLSGNFTLGNLSDGGAMFIYGMATLTRSTISGNSTSNNSSKGGGIFNVGTMDITNSTISGNFTLGTNSHGGGISNFFSKLTLTDSTVTGNSTFGTGSPGGGVSTQDDLDDDAMTLTRTLISGNTAVNSLGDEVYNFNTDVIHSYNLFGHDGLTTAQALEGLTAAASDIVATSDSPDSTPSNLILAGLADNGGSTFTHALVPGSPAINSAGDDCSSTDQRGIDRPQGAACDIGAYEAVVCGDGTVGGDEQCDDGNTSNGDCCSSTCTLDPNGSFCSDGSVCTQTDTCNGSGACVGGNLLNCADTNNCTVDACNAETGCTHAPLTCNGLPVNVCGTPGNDAILVLVFPAVVHGNGGNDNINAGLALLGLLGGATICGGDGNDILIGSLGPDKIFGDNGNDQIDGSWGNDAINGGTGTDTCIGGAGTDSATQCETVSGTP